MKESKPYLIDAVIGNSKFLASLGRNGRMYRLWWPNISFPQHVDCMRDGLYIQNNVQWFDDTVQGWTHDIQYVNRTNILTVNAQSTNCPISIMTTSFAVPGEDFIVRRYSFRNSSPTPADARFLHYSSFQITENSLYNTTAFSETDDSLDHFRHRYFFSVGSSNVCASYQAGGDVWHAVMENMLNGADIDMSPAGALGWDLSIPANGSTEITIYIAAGTNEQETKAVMHVAKSMPYSHWFDSTAQYWHGFLNTAIPCPISTDAVRKVYERSLLTMKLMTDSQTGAVIAAPEFDETFSRCGGYAYCWGRDAAFITSAMDRCGLTGLSSAFYDWTLGAQSPDGSWQQRHYHDGSLAPSWGLQIDESASILWGMWQHFCATGNDSFAERVWPAVQKGANFLVGFLDPLTGLPKPSVDLWEERLAEHVYSAGAVFGGLQSAAKFAAHFEKPELAAEWSNAAAAIQSAIAERCWNEDKNSFYRGLRLRVDEPSYQKAQESGEEVRVEIDAKGYKRYELAVDPIVDISLIGLSTPFGVFPVHDPRMAHTADTIEALLSVSGVGGIKRYEDDPYIGGNPWILTTLWLCHYRIQQGKQEAANELFNWALQHRTELDLLPEQIDKHTGETAWVVPLTWSHAMFVLAVHMLAENE